MEVAGDVLRLRCRLFLGGGPGCCAARAVKAGAADGFVDDLSVDVGVVNHTCVHPGHGPVITERYCRPIVRRSSRVPVAVAVIDSAVEPDGRAPVAVVKEVIAAVVGPVSWGPQESDARRKDPDARVPSNNRNRRPSSPESKYSLRLARRVADISVSGVARSQSICRLVQKKK